MGLLNLVPIEDGSQMVKIGDVIIFRRLVWVSDDDAASSPKHTDTIQKTSFRENLENSLVSRSSGIHPTLTLDPQGISLSCSCH